jgi:nucleoside-diphosphate-sugar epimerase
MARILVCGGGGFIGGHLVRRLQKHGHWLRSVDLFYKSYNTGIADEKIVGDLRDPGFCMEVCAGMDEVYQLSADMGGAGYIFTGANDADIMHNSILCNVNIIHACVMNKVSKVFFSSSACIYPYYNQVDADNPHCEEHSAYPAMPDSEYGWEKLFSERMYLAYRKNHHLNCKIGRFHNVYGPHGAWIGGKEKAPAAICRKVAEAEDGGSIDIWGTGLQTRSFLYIEDCLDAVIQLMGSDFNGPVNIGSEEMISINGLAREIIAISGKHLSLHHIKGPIGVNGRTSDNTLIEKELGWTPRISLREGLEHTYHWISSQVQKQRSMEYGEVGISGEQTGN